MNIILYLLNFIKYRQKIICQLLNFICKYIPLKQWAFDDSHFPKYQKFKVDVLPASFPMNRIEMERPHSLLRKRVTAKP